MQSRPPMLLSGEGSVLEIAADTECITEAGSSSRVLDCFAKLWECLPFTATGFEPTVRELILKLPQGVTIECPDLLIREKDDELVFGNVQKPCCTPVDTASTSANVAALTVKEFPGLDKNSGSQNLNDLLREYLLAAQPLAPRYSITDTVEIKLLSTSVTVPVKALRRFVHEEGVWHPREGESVEFRFTDPASGGSFWIPARISLTTAVGAEVVPLVTPAGASFVEKWRFSVVASNLRPRIDATTMENQDRTHSIGVSLSVPPFEEVPDTVISLEILNCQLPEIHSPTQLARIRRSVGLAEITVNSSGDNSRLVAFGGRSSAIKAMPLLTQLASGERGLLMAGDLQERRERRLRLLAERREAYYGMATEEFSVTEGCVGGLMGRQGERLARVARNCHVEVRVFPDDRGLRRVRLYGINSAVGVQAARYELEVLYRVLQLTPEAEEMVTKNGDRLRECCHKSSLCAMWYDAVTKSLILWGSRMSMAVFVHRFFMNDPYRHYGSEMHEKQASTSYRDHRNDKYDRERQISHRMPILFPQNSENSHNIRCQSNNMMERPWGRRKNFSSNVGASNGMNGRGGRRVSRNPVSSDFSTQPRQHRGRRRSLLPAAARA